MPSGLPVLHYSSQNPALSKCPRHSLSLSPLPLTMLSGVFSVPLNMRLYAGNLMFFLQSFIFTDIHSLNKTNSLKLTFVSVCFDFFSLFGWYHHHLSQRGSGVTLFPQIQIQPAPSPSSLVLIQFSSPPCFFHPCRHCLFKHL